MSEETTELQGILDEFEHECFMLRVEASETRAKDDVVRDAYEHIRKKTARAIADDLNVTLGDADYERRMDELLCRLTNGKWSKSRSYSVDFMVSCVDEAYEDAALSGGECEVECFDDGVDEGMDGEWLSYAPPTWYLSCGHDVKGTERPNYCAVCGKAVKR